MSFISRFRTFENSFVNFDTNLQVFYHDVLSEELDLSDSTKVSRIKQALRDVVHAYKKVTVDSNSSEILFDSSEKRYAYVMKHCPCFTSAVSKHFLQLLQRNPHVLDQGMRRREINLCCLGGGPGTEAVAIIKIINLLKNSAFLRDNEKIRLRILVIDLSEDWKSTTELVLQTVQRYPDFCDSEQIQIRFQLIKADLTDPLHEEAEKALHEADIITMVYFVSAVNGSKSQKKCVPMLQNVIKVAKPGALLFFLDSAKNLHYETIMESVGEFQNLRQIYGPFVQEFHTLSMKSIRMYIELYFNQFKAILCLTNCFITCASYCKDMCYGRDLQFTIKNDFRIIKNRKWYKMVEHNTRKQERFHRRVEKLFLAEMKLNFEADGHEESDCKNDMEFCFYHKIFYAGKAKKKRIFLEND